MDKLPYGEYDDVRRAFGYVRIFKFNDIHTHAQVLEFCDEAIARLEAK